MRLINPNFEHVFEIKEGNHFLVVIENPEIMRTYISDLIKQANGEDGPFVLSENNSELDISKNMDILSNVLVFETVDKSVTSKVNSLLKCFMAGENMFERTAILKTQIENYAIQLSEEFPYSLSYDELDISNLIKLMGIKPAVSYDSITEKISERMKLLHDICNISIFIIVNAFSFLTTKEINELIEDSNLEKHHLIFIDSLNPSVENSPLTKIIIDSDGCEIFD